MTPLHIVAVHKFGELDQEVFPQNLLSFWKFPRNGGSVSIHKQYDYMIQSQRVEVCIILGVPQIILCGFKAPLHQGEICGQQLALIGRIEMSQNVGIAVQIS